MVGERVADVIIVGAGPAGCVLASRLTEDPERTVVLLEAGPDYGPDPADWPADLRNPNAVWPESHPWGYLHAGRPADDPFPLPRARVVGGTSTINACFWLRGSAADYDGWETLGNPGWSFAELLPFFRRSETDPMGGPLHGTEGPVPISRVTEANLTPVDQAFAEAAETLGFPRVDDANGGPVQRPGVSPMPKNVAGGMRMNAAFTYLAPARGRPNLELIPDALVDRVVIVNGHAAGVQLAGGRTVHGAEIILCAGAFGSPAILMRSGIGPADHLGDVGIPVVMSLPGVGQHLLDHPILDVFTTATVRPDRAPTAGSLCPNFLKARSSQAGEEIDLHIYHGQYFDEDQRRWVLWFSISLAHARSRGRVRLTAVDPEATLEIDHRHLTEPAELEAFCDAVELVNALMATSPLTEMIEVDTGWATTWRMREELREAVQSHVATTYHPSSTCRMGPASDDHAVVDHLGRVHGVAGLRVADAAIFPTGPRANLHCTVVAVAEKLADAVRRAAS